MSICNIKSYWVFIKLQNIYLKPLFKVDKFKYFTWYIYFFEKKKQNKTLILSMAAGIIPKKRL